MERQKFSDTGLGVSLVGSSPLNSRLFPTPPGLLTCTSLRFSRMATFSAARERLYSGNRSPNNGGESATSLNVNPFKREEPASVESNRRRETWRSMIWIRSSPRRAGPGRAGQTASGTSASPWPHSHLIFKAENRAWNASLPFYTRISAI